MIYKMRTNYKPNLLLLLLFAVLLVSCNEYKRGRRERAICGPRDKPQLPIDIQNAQITEARVVMTNVSSRQEYAVTAFRSEQDKYVANITLPEGTYNLTVNGVVKYQLNKKEIKAKVKAKRDNVVVQATSKATNNRTKMCLQQRRVSLSQSCSLQAQQPRKASCTPTTNT